MSYELVRKVNRLPYVQLASYLQGRGLAAASYYGSMSGAARQAVAERLAAGKLKVVTCTTALSSGLDLHNVDGVLHNAMPASLEDYVQQVCATLFYIVYGSLVFPGFWYWFKLLYRAVVLYLHATSHSRASPHLFWTCSRRTDSILESELSAYRKL